MQRGEVWKVRLGPVVGHEIDKARPVVVVGQSFGSIVTVVPLTKRKRPWVRQVSILPPEGGLRLPSFTTDQVRSVDRRRFVCYLGQVGDESMAAVDDALADMLCLA